MEDNFQASRTAFAALVGFLDGGDATGLTHGELEERIRDDGFELLRLLFQDHLDLRASREERLAQVLGADGITRSYAEDDHRRPLVTIFGDVTVARLAYRRKRATNLHPADAGLNLPEEIHSHGLRRIAATEAARGSFDEAVAAIERTTAAGIGKRQVQALTQAATVDFEAFFDQLEPPPAEPAEVVVISADGKGIVMRPEGLRAATAAKAATSDNKLKGRLSGGEKANRKRMAEVGAVYTVTPVQRTPQDVMAQRGDGPPKRAPTATNKWLTASVVEDTAQVISRIFAEAERRDPQHARPWMALVDGNNHQIDRIGTEAARRGIDITIQIDWVHVLELSTV